MRILMIDEEIPFPLNSGKRLRTYNLLKHLATRSQITYLCRLHEGLEKPHIQALEKFGIKTIVLPHPIMKKTGARFYLALIANLFSKYPYVVTSHRSMELVNAARNLMTRDSFDLIHCEWTPYAANLKAFLSYPSVVVAHNVESLVWQRHYEVESDPFKKMYIYLQWKKMEQFERNTFSLFSRSIAVSERDRDIISQWVSRDRIDVVPNGVDVDHFKPSWRPQKPRSLVFSGAMDWRPNVDCMLYFLDEVWPLVLKTYPDSSLTIVGRRPLRILRNRVAGAPAVTLTGTVEDVRPYIESATAYIVPLRVGGGSRLKILEAFSMHKPVVSTSVGAEGLEVLPGKDLLIADESRSFAAAIIRLFEDAGLRESLGSSGRILVEKQYQWKRLAEKLEQVWTNVAGLNNEVPVTQRQRKYTVGGYFRLRREVW